MISDIKSRIDRNLPSQERQIHPQKLEGEWEFQGYYPKKCVKAPKCHTKRIGFQIDKSTEHRKPHWHCFDTKAQLQGTGCE